MASINNVSDKILINSGCTPDKLLKIDFSKQIWFLKLIIFSVNFIEKEKWILNK